jgi:hypothetical protein
MNEDQKILREIEAVLYKKFKHLEKDQFLRHDERWGEHETLDYEEVIDLIAEYVLDDWDDEQGIEQIEQIPEKDFDKWFAQFEYPEECCDRCGGRGCNYCLMCEY